MSLFGPTSALPFTLFSQKPANYLKSLSKREKPYADDGDLNGAKFTSDNWACGRLFLSTLCISAGFMRWELKHQDDSNQKLVSHEDFHSEIANLHRGTNIQLKGLTISNVKLEFLGHTNPADPHQIPQAEFEDGLHHCYMIGSGQSAIIVLINPMQIFEKKHHRILGIDESMQLSVVLGNFAGPVPVIYCKHPDCDQAGGLVVP